jgi:CHC2 zinc finger
MSAAVGIDYDAICERNLLPEYCERRGIKLRPSGGSLVGKCPLHHEHHGEAFVVFTDGHWRCFGKCGKSGDVIDLEQALGGGTLAEAAARLGVARPTTCHSVATGTPRLGPDIDGIEPCSERYLRRIAKVRQIPPEGLRLARGRRILFSYEEPYQGSCYLATDDARRNAIYRRLDGERFQCRESGEGKKEGPKSKNWKGSEASWPIGVAQASGFPAIALTEGMPDLLSAFWLAYAGAVESLVAPVCMGGAACSIHKDALPMFRGKRVRIFGHADEAGRGAVQRWAEQLRGVQAEVDGFDFSGMVKQDGSTIKDLNDFILADHKQSGCSIEVVTGAMDFALERRA